MRLPKLPASFPPSDAHASWEERAALAEFHGGLDREAAELLASLPPAHPESAVVADCGSQRCARPAGGPQASSGAFAPGGMGDGGLGGTHE